MAILIKGLMSALEYKPIRATYAIRIRSSTLHDEYFLRLTSSNYVGVNEYIFDDIDPEDYNFDRGGIFFDLSIARKILTDFVSQRANALDLLVHCSRGQNRSPAIALGMNKIFYLGADSERIIRESPGGRWWMTNLLLDEAKKLGLIKKVCPNLDNTH